MCSLAGLKLYVAEDDFEPLIHFQSAGMRGAYCSVSLGLYSCSATELQHFGKFIWQVQGEKT